MLKTYQDLQRDFVIVPQNVGRSQNKYFKRIDLDVNDKKLVFLRYYLITKYKSGKGRKGKINLFSVLDPHQISC